MIRCVKCVLPDTYPGIEFDDDGVCIFCNQSTDEKEDKKYNHYKTKEELGQRLRKYVDGKDGYDILIPLSGGVDSSVALINIVEKMGLNALGFHFDHGFEDTVATDNVKRLCSELNTDLIIRHHNNDFYLKLWRYFNEASIMGLSGCYLCGNMLYLEAIEMAKRLDISLIVNGYSKGQTSLLDKSDSQIEKFEEFFQVILKDEKFFNQFMKKQQWLNYQHIFKSDKDLEEKKEDKILIIPYYLFNFNKTDKEILQKECIDRFDWKPMKATYPDRTTNCEMIWLNVYFDYKKMGYSVYDEEYSTLIRAGEMTREQAIKDLQFNPPDHKLEHLASKIDIEL